MTIHKIQGLTCNHLVFHPAGIPSSAFAYVALSRVRSRHAIVLTSKLSMNDLTATRAAKVAFKSETDRIRRKTQACKEKVQEVIPLMQAIARQHNMAHVGRL